MSGNSAKHVATVRTLQFGSHLTLETYKLQYRTELVQTRQAFFLNRIIKQEHRMWSFCIRDALVSNVKCPGNGPIL